MLKAITSAFNWLLNCIADSLIWLINLLPDSPFQGSHAVPSSIDLGYVTWAIPFPTMIAHFALLLGAITTYYTLRIALRWVKAARD